MGVSGSAHNLVFTWSLVAILLCPLVMVSGLSPFETALKFFREVRCFGCSLLDMVVLMYRNLWLTERKKMNTERKIEILIEV